LLREGPKRPSVMLAAKGSEEYISAFPWNMQIQNEDFR
jgi:hypothetical protein